MIYPESIEEKLGFDVIRQRIFDYCKSELGRKLVPKIGFKTDKGIINRSLNQVAEFIQLLAQGQLPAFGSIVDINSSLEKSVVKGNWLSGAQLFEIFETVTTALQMAEYVGLSSVDYPSLKNLNPEIGGLNILEKHLLIYVDKDGVVLSSASKELKSIRQKMLAEQ